MLKLTKRAFKNATNYTSNFMWGLWFSTLASFSQKLSKTICTTRWRNKTLFQNSSERLTGKQFKNPVIVTNSDYRFIVTEQLQEIGIDPGAILIEPEGRNTAPAILAAALFEYRKNPDAILVVAPSDHVINDSKRVSISN